MEITLDDPVEIVRRLLGFYHQGIITEMELLTMLIEAATQHEPSMMADTLPSEWLEALTVKTANLPADPSEVVYVSGILGGPNFDYEAYYANKRQQWWAGAKRWHLYFNQDTQRSID